MLIHWFRTKIC